MEASFCGSEIQVQSRLLACQGHNSGGLRARFHSNSVLPIRAALSSGDSPSPFTEWYSESRNRINSERSPATSTRIQHVSSLKVGPSEPERIPTGNDHENDIALRLPELKDLLQALRQKRLSAGEADGNKGPGNVFLVGTGPGDVELLTLKAVRLLQSADLVLYDRLVGTEVLELAHPGARLLYVGKTAGYHSRTQDEIHELLLQFAEAGASVVRLKGGDPLVFGRGGEEMEFLQAQGIRVEIVPGITAASGISACLGIPLTHRGVANSVRFLTGHSRKGGEDPLFVAETAADPDSTLVVYMGLATLPGLVARLMDGGPRGGLLPTTPAVAVERGTTSLQRTVFSEVADLPSAVCEARLASPTLIIIGQVVALSPLWHERGQEADGSAAADNHHSRTAHTSQAVDVAAREVEPRDRTHRGPDPLLPSERSSTV